MNDINKYELEREYKNYFHSLRISRAKFSFLFAIFLVPLSIFFDYFIYPEKLMSIILIRIVCVILLISFYFLLDFEIGKKYNVVITMASAIILGAGIILMTVITEGYRSPYYAGLILILIAYAVVLPWNIKESLFASLSLYFLYIVVTLLTSKITDIGVFMNSNYFLLFTIVMVIISSIFNTRLRDKEFYSRFSLQSANKELSKLDELKSQFFSNVSHELRTPLTSIVAPLDTLSAKSLTDMPYEQIEMYHKQMLLNAKKLLKLINDLLDFSKLEAGKMGIKCKKLNLKNVLEELVQSIQSLAVQKYLKLEFEIPQSEIELYLDSAKIEKVFLNLLSNAIKFTPENGTIKIMARERDNSVQISVTDTGIGMPKEELPKIFERFHQVDGSSTRSYGGTGIGLNLAKELVELHKGKISVESEVGKGTTFTVELLKGKAHLDAKEISEEEIKSGNSHQPIPNRRSGERRMEDRRYMDPRKLQLADIQADQTSKQSLIEEIKKEEAQSAAGSDLPVIQIVEDDAGIIALIRNTLKNDYRIFVAFDGKEGWDSVQKNMPDLVLSDLMMPHLSGFELTSLIKQDKKTKHIPVILLTAKGELIYKIQGLEIGADDYLAKPFNEDELKARVRSLINLRKLENELAKTNQALAESYSKLKDAESQLIYTDKIRSLGIMMMGLAHELNNPLSFISGGAKGLHLLMDKQAELKNKEDVYSMLDSVDEGVKRCFTVMDELKKFARRDKVHYEEIDLRDNIESTLKMLKHLTGSRIKIVKDYKSEKSVECNSSYVNQVVLNILHNAVLAIPENGIITIRTSDDGQNYALEIEDTGVGIKKENLKNVFDPFFTTRDPNKGMGLGLSVSYKIISDHGGKMELKSEQGKGTTVAIILPMKQIKKEGNEYAGI